MAAAAARTILPSIHKMGFAVRPISPPVQAVLSRALKSWAKSGEFRFPPITEHPRPVSGSFQMSVIDCGLQLRAECRPFNTVMCQSGRKSTARRLMLS
jgi:hypothetical protein